MITKLISGGQTGVDRAALDVARELGIPHGGWCPKGRKAEDGAIPPHYLLEETPSASYPQRTEWNIRDSDATLILTIGGATGGTLLTLSTCRAMHKPVLVVDLAGEQQSATWRCWLAQWQTVNVAGPRASKHPGIGNRAAALLRDLLGHHREKAPAALLADLLSQGFTVRAVAGRVRVAPASRLSPAQVAAIRACRDELLALVEEQAIDHYMVQHLPDWQAGPVQLVEVLLPTGVLDRSASAVPAPEPPPVVVPVLAQPDLFEHKENHGQDL